MEMFSQVKIEVKYEESKSSPRFGCVRVPRFVEYINEVQLSKRVPKLVQIKE